MQDAPALRSLLMKPWGTVAAAVLLTGCAAASNTSSSGPAAPSAANPSTMRGTLALTYGQSVTGAGTANYTGGNTNGAPCHGENGFDDINANAQVTVSDASDKVVGVANLGDGTTGPDPSGKAALACVFTFTVTDLPKATFYKVEVSHRGQVTFPRSGIGDVQLTLGS